MTRSRLNIFIEADHARRLEDVSAHRGVSKSSIVAAALSSFLAPDSADQREAANSKRLDHLSSQLSRLERDQNILVETVALYVRVFLTVSIPVPASQQEAARAQGRARYQQFIEQLGRHLQSGRRLVREVHEDMDPPASDTPEEGETPTLDTADAASPVPREDEAQT